MSKIIRFLSYDCTIVTKQFANGQLCLTLVGANTRHNQNEGIMTGEPICKASVFVDGLAVAENQTCIKDYSENKGIYEVLRQADVISEAKASYILGNPDTNVHVVDILKQA
jgi:hypothetical protein